jgi:hypothetical protein
MKSMPRPIWLAPTHGSRGTKALRRSLFLLILHQVICPTGALHEILSIPLAKIFHFRFSEICVFLFASRPDAEGRYGQSSRNVGRGAVDATMSCAHEVAGRGQTRERSSKARKTSGMVADGEGVWSWHPLLVSSLAEAHSAQPGCEMPSNP